MTKMIFVFYITHRMESRTSMITVADDIPVTIPNLSQKHTRVVLTHRVMRETASVIVTVMMVTMETGLHAVGEIAMTFSTVGLPWTGFILFIRPVGRALGFKCTVRCQQMEEDGR